MRLLVFICQLLFVDARAAPITDVARFIDDSLLTKPLFLHEMNLPSEGEIEKTSVLIKTQILKQGSLISKKLIQLENSRLTKDYSSLNQRNAATNRLLRNKPSSSAPESIVLSACLSAAYPDFITCKAEAIAYLKAAEMGNATFTEQYLRDLNGLAICSTYELLALQQYETQLKTTLLHLNHYLHTLKMQMQKAELIFWSQDPAMQCNPQLPTLRLDQDSLFKNKPVATTLKNAIVQDQGLLNTCFANAASIAFEALTGEPNSAVDLAMNFWAQKMKTRRDARLNTGGGICAVFAAAKISGGLCKRENHPIDDGPVITVQKYQETYQTILGNKKETRFNQIIASTPDQGIESLIRAISPQCTRPEDRIPVQNLDCNEYDRNKLPDFYHSLPAKLIGNLAAGRPLGITYDGHQALLAGIRYNKFSKRCDYLLWNSWGASEGKRWMDQNYIFSYVVEVSEFR